MGENNFNNLIDNINNMFVELVLLEKELINYKEQIAKLKKQNEILREALAWFGDFSTSGNDAHEFALEALKKVEGME
jgi:hypothetical protein